MNEYDDPYNFLALHIISTNTAHEIERALTDDKYVQMLLIKEVRNLDLKGPFCDCIIENILTGKRRMKLMGHLDELSRYLFSELDLEYLRERIEHYLLILDQE